MLEAIPVPFALLDEGLRFVDQSRALREFLGYPDANLLGKDLHVVLGAATLTAAAAIGRTGRYQGDLDVLSADGTSLAAHVELQDAGRDHEGTHLIAAVFRPLHGSRQPQLERSLSLLQATLESTADGLLIVDRGGKIVGFNRRFAKMWDLAPETLATRDDAAALTEAVAKVKDPQAFLERVRYLYEHPEERSLESIELLDGRIFERYSRPQRLGDEIVARVWSFRDVTDRERTERALRQSEERYRQLFAESRQAIYITARDGSVLEANPAALRLFGYEAADLPRVNVLDLYENPEQRAEFVQRIEADGSIDDFHVRLRTRDGRVMECLLTSTLLRDSAGTVVGYQGIVEDVTERIHAERALRENELRFRSLIENASDTITILDQNGQITYESPSIERVLGYTPEMLIGHNVFEYVHPDDQPATLDRFQRMASIEGHTTRIEVRFLHGDGSWRVLDVVGQNLLADPAIRGIVVNARDVTESKEAEARLRHDAFHDRLTQLPNRALLLDRMGQFLRRFRRDQHPFSVLFLDLDRFKVVNDSLGHMVGDQLLIAIAKRLESSLRPGDTVARLGGDEFTMLLEGADIQEARRVADRVQEDIQVPFTLGRHEIYTTVSVGIVTSEGGYTSPEDMLRDADLAMYRAKDRGRARMEVFDAGMWTEALGNLELETDLRRAVERDEFEMFFQPIVRLDDGSVYGFEALLRWHHPQRGLLMPAEFLELADDTGLIVPVGWWVIRAVCRQLREWSDSMGKAAVPVQVNLSAHQLVRADFVDTLFQALEEHGAPAQLLHLELTESTMMENAESTIGTLRDLKSLGIGLLIDDFGTGYSSLSYLHRFPTDSVKIDRSFVAGMGPLARDSSVIRTIVALAHDLRMHVIAEGIETEAQAATLRGMGCEGGQGFLFSRPLPFEAATRMLASGCRW